MSHTLLLADDSVTVRRVIELTFADENVRVVAVGDGSEAIARIDREPPDIVLADIGMPGRDGYEVAAFVKGRPDLAHIPVVLLAGAFEPLDRARAEALGCEDVLVKPFEPHLVIARVKELLAGPGDRRAAEPATAAHDRDARAPDAPDDRVAAVRESADEFFERLDAAFARLTAGSSDADVAGAAVGTPATVPSAVVESRSEAPRQADRPVPGPEPTPPVTFAGPDPGGATHVLADAFHTLLALEQGERPDAVRGPRPARAIDPALVDQVVARVLERLSDRVARDTVRELVADIAERLVREEIERIKAAAS